MTDVTLEDHIDNLRTHPDAGVRANSAWRIGHMRDYRCLEPLLEAIHDPSAAVRARVIEALGSRREPAIIAAIEQGLYDTDEDVRAMAARAAALVAATELTPRLYELLADPSVRVIGEAIQALAYSEDADVGTRLTKMLQIHPDDSTLRYFVRHTLAQQGDIRTVNALIAVLAQPDTPVGILIDMLEVLAQRRERAARGAVEALIHHADEDVAATARWALGQL